MNRATAMEGGFPNLQLNHRVGISDENVPLDFRDRIMNVGFEFTSRIDDPHFLDMMMDAIQDFKVSNVLVQLLMT